MNHPYSPEPPLPQNIELEQSLIGTVLRNNAVYDRVSSLLDADDFFEPIHRLIWDGITEFAAQGKTANPLTLRDILDPSQMIGELTPFLYLVRISTEFGQALNATDYAEMLKALSTRRKLIAAADEIRSMALAASPTAKLSEITTFCEETLSEAIALRQTTELTSGAQAAIDEISSAYRDQKSRAVPWCLGEAQQVLGDDLEFGWLVGLLADSGGGKTSLALQQARHALDAGFPVLVLSGDQKPAEVYRQMASQTASVKTSDLRKGRATETEVFSVIDTIRKLSKLPFKVEKMGRPTTAEIGMKIRGFNRQFGKGLIIIDHAKRISFTDRRIMLAEGVNQVYGDLKSLMQETENAGLLLMQRNSDGTSRENPRPIRSDAYGGAGALENLDGLLALYVEEQWFDHMLSMARSDKRKAEVEARREFITGRAELIGLKARFSEQGIRKVIVREARFTRFASMVSQWTEQEALL